MSSADLKFTKDHEWIKLTGEEAEVGITDYAQRQLGDVVYVELPEVGHAVSRRGLRDDRVRQGCLGAVYADVGEVTAVNTELTSKPEQVNSAPDTTWIIKLKLSQAR